MRFSATIITLSQHWRLRQLIFIYFQSEICEIKSIISLSQDLRVMFNMSAPSCRDKQWADSKIKTHPLDNLCENSEKSLRLLALSVFIFYLVKYLTQCCAMRRQKHKSLIFSRADLSRAGWFKIAAFTLSSGKFRCCIDRMHLQILCYTCWLFSLQSIQQSILKKKKARTEHWGKPPRCRLQKTLSVCPNSPNL